MSQPASVVGIGAATWDEFWRVDGFAAEETVLTADAHLGMGGGPVATALCVLARLGHGCALVDCQGDDSASQAAVLDLQHHGVCTRHVQIVPGTRGARAMVLVRAADGARQIIYSPATGGEPRWGPDEDALLAGARLLHLNGRHEVAARAALTTATNHGITVSFDGGAGRFRESVRDLVAASHVRNVAREFAERLTGQTDIPAMMSELLRPPARIAVITGGLDGSWIAVPGGKVHHEPARQANPLVDTTGCGDVYHGAFLHGWLSAWTPERCAAFASALASRNAEGLGGRHVLNQPLM
jgi:sugar/nucleoside kinase (ribokinase family)